MQENVVLLITMSDKFNVRYFQIRTARQAGVYHSQRRGQYRCFVWKTTEQSSLPTRSIEDILGAHLICDDIWGGTNQSNVSIDTANSKEVTMTDSHITEQHIFKFYQRQTMLQTTQQIQQLPITSTKKIKNMTVNRINNILVANTMVVQNKSQKNWYPTLFQKKKKTVFINGLTGTINGIIHPTHL